MKIKELLTIDLTEDIKNVIDLEDLSEAEIKSEIENYIVTDGLAREYAKFVGEYTSSIRETGVWISGFYGSGKSYFGKMLGYMLSDRSIAGTPARKRILQRFTGITDEALVTNSIVGLDSVKSRIVFLDAAKQDTSKGFAFTLFRNFLKSLDLPDNEHGFFLYQLMVDAKSSDIDNFISQKLGQDWNELKNNLLGYSKAAKSIFLKNDNSDDDYTNLMTTIRREMDQFSAAKLKDELNNYLQIIKDERIVFLFDEASEAINQKKFNLLDLEGLSEALSALGGKVWTIAIAQERLDDVINNSNVDVTQLTKVTDRFKTKIHLEATEVDVIIRSRLLKKNDAGIDSLRKHFNSNSGKISDHSSLTGVGINKTEDVDSYTTYYPFYKNHFNLLQNFLFGTKGYASTKVAARGMIITTYEILKKELQNEDIFGIATGWQIAREAQPQPKVTLVLRYDKAESVLREEGSAISGRKLLETINFLKESESVSISVPNIVKSFIKDPEKAHSVREVIEKALDLLVQARVLLVSGGEYRITSDIEQRFLDEMKQFVVQNFIKKKNLTAVLKSSPTIKELARITDSGLQYDFHVATDNEDDLTTPKLKQLKIKIKTLYNFGENPSADIESIRTQYQNDKDLLWLVPDNSSFEEIDKLIDEIERVNFLEQKYQSPGPDEEPIIRNFQTQKTEKENRVKELVERSLQNGVSVYLYSVSQLEKNIWQTVLSGQQRQMILNIFSKRLDSQLGDKIAEQIIKEANGKQLKSYLTGPDFQFFDTDGNFIGENLKPAEEVLLKIRNTFVDGATLEKDLEIAPTGYTFGTVISTVSALMRGGKAMAKYDGETQFSWRDSKVSKIFSNAREFRKASFKAVSKSLSASQKSEVVTSLQGLEYDRHTGEKIDWNTNDFDLVNAVRELAKRFCDKVEDMKTQHEEFDTLFGGLEDKKENLAEFIGVVSENNYIDKATVFLENKDQYSEAINAIENAEKFISKNLPKLRLWKQFADGVNDELKKSAKTNLEISRLSGEFQMYYETEVVKNFGKIQQTVQKMKDEYFSLMQTATAEMSEKYNQLKTDVERLVTEISILPAGLNDATIDKANAISQYADQRTKPDAVIDLDIKDKETKFTYSEILSFIELYSSKKTEVDILRSSLIREAPQPVDIKNGKSTPQIQTIQTNLPGTKLKVGKYRQWLKSELQKIAGANETDEIEFNN